MFHGEYEAESFPEAVRQAVAKQGMDPHLVSYKNLTYWGCRFYDNEADARRSFG
jgi:hypothetical protein